MKALLITGTDTDVGKTVLTTALAAYWQTYRFETLGLMKLMQTGEGDRQLYSRLFQDTNIEISVPLQFEEPLAPPVAAEKAGCRVDLAAVWQGFKALSQQFVLVEALGGLGSPLTSETTVADLARDWHLQTVLVVPVKLGALGAAVANTALAREAGVPLAGIVLNCSTSEAEFKQADWTPTDLLQSLTNVPVLGTIPYLANPDAIAQLVQVASNLDLERLLPKLGYLGSR